MIPIWLIVLLVLLAIPTAIFLVIFGVAVFVQGTESVLGMNDGENRT